MTAGIVAASGVLSTSNYAAEVLADSPLVYWKLAEASGTTMADSSGNARDGGYFNSPTLGQSGPIAGDTAVLFDGTNQFGLISYASWMAGLTALTLEAWVKTTATSGTIVGRGNSVSNYRLGVTGGKAFVEITTGTNSTTNCIGTSSINNGGWHYICGRWTGSTLVIEVDGVQENTASKSGSINSVNNDLRVAQRNNDSFFAGTIAHAALYGTNIGPTRMAAHYAAR